MWDYNNSNNRLDSEWSVKVVVVKIVILVERRDDE